MLDSKHILARVHSLQAPLSSKGTAETILTTGCTSPDQSVRSACAAVAEAASSTSGIHLYGCQKADFLVFKQALVSRKLLQASGRRFLCFLPGGREEQMLGASAIMDHWACFPWSILPSGHHKIMKQRRCRGGRDTSQPRYFH